MRSTLFGVRTTYHVWRPTDVDAKAGHIRGQRTGKRIGIGDVVTVRIARIDLPRRELDLSVTELKGRKGGHEELTDAPAPEIRQRPQKGKRSKQAKHEKKQKHRGRAQHPLRGGGSRQKRHTPGRRRR